MNTKATPARVEIKDEARGEFSAVFSTLNVIDADGDVTLPGAFEQGAKVRISAYGHGSWNGRLPVGKGVIREAGGEAIVTGRFFLDTPDGRATFTVVRELGADNLAEFSYGYDVIRSRPGEWDGRPVRFLERLKVHEVSPVLVGAGVNTRLLSAKDALAAEERARALARREYLRFVRAELRRAAPELFRGGGDGS